MYSLVLTMASLVTVYSAISTLAYKADGNSAKFLFKQVGLLSLGWLVMFGVHRIHFKYFSKLANLVMVLAVAQPVQTSPVGTTTCACMDLHSTRSHRSTR